jgi:hypothetical protein
VLTQIQIPRGVRVINLNAISYTRVDEIPDDVFNLLRKSECGSFFSQGMGPRTILSFMLGDHVGRDERSDECFRLSREIFNERLKIDLVGYSFSRSVLPAICPNLKTDEKREVDSVRRSYRNGKTGFVSPDLVAFIILRSEPFSRNDVRIYNYQSTDDEAARSHIQSLYLSSQGVDLSRPLWQNLKSADKADLARWARGNIFGCDSSVDFGL